MARLAGSAYTPAMLKELLKDAGWDQVVLAERIGRDQSRVSRWLAPGGKVPSELVRTIAELTGIPLYRIRPDVFPPPRRARRRGSNERTRR